MADTEPKSDVIFCLLKLTSTDGTVSYDASGLATEGVIPRADLDALERAGKAAVAGISYSGENAMLMQKTKDQMARIQVLTNALTAAGIPVPA